MLGVFSGVEIPPRRSHAVPVRGGAQELFIADLFASRLPVAVIVK